MTDRPSLSLADPIEDQTSLAYMLRLSAPTIVSTISFTTMQFVDRLMVSRLGKEALAAVLPAGFVAFIPAGFALGTISSLNTYVSQSLGRGDRQSCSNYFWQTIYMGLAYFIAVVVLMSPTAPWIFRLMGQPPSVIEMEVIYLRIILYAHVPAVINWASNQFFIGIHRPIVTMCSSLCGQVVNVMANYLLIFGKFGFPRLGIAGAGWGTFIGIGVASAVNMFIYLSPTSASTYRTRHTLRVDFHRMRDLLTVGLPAGFGQMVDVALWGVILSALVGRFGEEALAATSAALAYISLSIMPIVGLSMALSAAVGKSIGAGRKDRVAKQTRTCLRIALVYMAVVGASFFTFRGSLMAFWSKDANVVAVGANILICAAVYQAFYAARVIYTGALRGAGDTVWVAYASAAGALFVLGLGGAVVVAFLPRLGAMGPWLAATTSIIAVGLANAWRFRTKRWMTIDLFKRKPGAPPLQNGSPA